MKMAKDAVDSSAQSDGILLVLKKVHPKMDEEYILWMPFKLPSRELVQAGLQTH